MHGLVYFFHFYPGVATIWCGSNFTASYSNLHVSKDGIRTEHFLLRKQQACQIEPLRTIAGGYGI